MLAPPEGGKEASPSFLEFGATEPFDPPALLAGLGAADAFRVVSDLAAGLSKKRICIVIDCLHLLHLGESNPHIFGCFLPCVGFSEMGRDTYSTPEKKTAHKRDSGFCFAEPRKLRTLRKFYDPDFCEDCEVSEGGTYQTSSTLPGVESV